MPRPLKIEVDLHALKKNFFVAQRFAPNSHHFSVIKGNAYGHGLLRVARSLREAGTHGYAMLGLNDAITLREHHIKHKILLLEGLFDSKECLPALQKQIDFVIHHDEQLKFFESFELAHQNFDALKGKKSHIFLKINTGMNRLGIRPHQVNEFVKRLNRLLHVGKITLMTHFALADEPEGIFEQLKIIQEIKNRYYYEFGSMPELCMANSASICRYPQSHANWVRPGIMLYGGSPFADTSAESLGLRPVMTLSSELISIQEIKSGDRVGYGGSFKAEHDMKIGVVACGYADGYPRHAPTGTPILVNGVRTQIVGRVSMDMLTVDLSHIPSAIVGSPVILWGKGLAIEEIATASKTINYELMCGITQRVQGYEYNSI